MGVAIPGCEILPRGKIDTCLRVGAVSRARSRLKLLELQLKALSARRHLLVRRAFDVAISLCKNRFKSPLSCQRPLTTYKFEVG